MAARSVLKVLLPISLVAACGDNVPMGPEDIDDDPIDEVPMLSVHVELAGNGAGTVAAPGIACGEDCDEEYASGSEVVLVAAPAEGSYFAGWSGVGCADLASAAPLSCAATVDGAMNLVATFTLEQHALSVAVVGEGSGIVTSDPAGIECEASCEATFDHGTQVTLTAAPAVGSELVGWSSPSCPGTGPCTVSMIEARSITADFGIQRHALTIARDGTGVGTVTSLPAGIDCGLLGTACTVAFAHGTQVELVATPAASSVFAGWAGGCTGTGSCTVSIDDAKSVTATFNIQPTVTSFQTTGAWACAGIGVNCQDVYEIDVNAGTLVGVSVSDVTGWSAVRMAVYENIGITNLFTNDAKDFRCSEQNGPTAYSFTAPSTGRYRIAIGRDWNFSGGSSGTYSVLLTASSPFISHGLTVNDGSTTTASICYL
jgi:hypothetical protein